MNRQETESRIWKIVITGGPCAGKSTALKSVRQHYQDKGWVVVTIKETATELIESGLRREYCSDLQFQISVMQLQLAKERTFEEALRSLGFEKALIVCDRGILDNRAYIDDELYRQVLAMNDLDHDQAQKRYDAVFHMASAAVHVPHHYNLSSNASRREGAQEAADLDAQVIRAWSDHPCFASIAGTDDFQEKIDHLIDAIEVAEAGFRGRGPTLM